MPDAKFAIYAHLKAKPGKTRKAGARLSQPSPWRKKRSGTITWYAFHEHAESYGIYDTFATEQDRQAHLDGPIAKALMAKASELLAEARDDPQN